MGHKKKERVDPLSMALPPGGVDSHAHLDGPEFAPDREDVLTRAAAAGLSQVGNVFLGPWDYAQRRECLADHAEVFFLLGIHPNDGQRCDAAALAAMREAFASDMRLRAVGEIGLDFHWDDCPAELQYAAFQAQLDMARTLERPVVIHCREAEDACLALLEARGFAGYPLLWHCFGGGPELARRIVRNGWHVSVPGPVNYPANASLREAVKTIPADRLLLETDAPYLSPEPWRGRRNEPAHTVFTARCVAELRNMPPGELWQQCGDNARRFFGL